MLKRFFERWKCPNCGKRNKFDRDSHNKKCMYTDCKCGYRYDVWGVPSAFHVKNSIQSNKDYGRTMNAEKEREEVCKLHGFKM